jgi:hypothetical protein
MPHNIFLIRNCFIPCYSQFQNVPITLLFERVCSQIILPYSTKNEIALKVCYNVTFLKKLFAPYQIWYARG